MISCHLPKTPAAFGDLLSNCWFEDHRLVDVSFTVALFAIQTHSTSPVGSSLYTVNAWIKFLHRAVACLSPI